jgi:LysM repeat protein
MFVPLTRRFGAAVLAGASLLALTSCSEDGSGASASTVEIQPSSYVVKDPVTTTAPTTVVAAPDEEGRSAGEQAFTVQSSNDVPWVVAQLYEVDLDELRNFNGWDEDFSDYPGIGGVVRIPPGAKFIDPSVTTTTAAADDEATDTTDGDGATAAPAGDRCNPIYVVESGDAPLVITRKFDITLEQLNAANEGVTPDWPNLYTGREVKLPPPADCP